MISSGLFVLPGLAHALAGPAVVISYIIAGLLAMAGMFSQAELVSAMPKAGGTYFYVARSMGPAVATVDGLLTWLSISLKSAFALVGMAAFTKIIITADIHIIAVSLCMLFLFINFIGIKEAGRVQVLVVTVLMFLLGMYIFMGMSSVKGSNFFPFMPYGIAPIFSTAGFVFVSYGGLLKVASIAEEVKDPAKTVPLGMMLSFVVVSILYALTVFVTTGVLSSSQLDNSLTPISDGAMSFMGEWGFIALGIAAVLAFVSTANAGIMSASRYPLALSRDRLLPKQFANIHKKFKTPYVAILATGLFMICAFLLNLKVLVEVASTVLIFTFIFSCICVIIMRESGVQNYRPRFRAPFYPWLQIIGIFGCWLLVVNMGREALFFGSLLFACGFSVYWFYGRIRVKKDYALLHLIEKVTAREFVDVSLEEELREIIRERDQIVKDRFDKIVEDSVVIDIEKPMTAEEFFRKAAEIISKKTGTDESVVFKLFLEREKQGSTVLSPGLAIPHIIIEGQKKFVILLARCRQGISFPEADGKVTTVFVIAGSRDERVFHLQALSAIAQIVQDPKFGKRWDNAKDEQALKEVVLLGERKRGE
jgi:amino acid transporter/mannitol/fructose-specific phosphotransferase system IIA component (Ntr-type)